MDFTAKSSHNVWKLSKIILFIYLEHQNLNRQMIDSILNVSQFHFVLINSLRDVKWMNIVEIWKTLPKISSSYAHQYWFLMFVMWKKCFKTMTDTHFSHWSEQFFTFSDQCVDGFLCYYVILAGNNALIRHSIEWCSLIRPAMAHLSIYLLCNIASINECLGWNRALMIE